MNFNHQDFKCSVGNNTQLITRRLEFKRVAIRFFDEGQKLVTSALNTLYGGQFTLSTHLIKSNDLFIPPPPPLTQHHSFFRNLPPLFIWYSVTCTLKILGIDLQGLLSQSIASCNHWQEKKKRLFYLQDSFFILGYLQIRHAQTER